MPTYTFINVETEEETTSVMSLSERDEFLKDGKHKQKLITPRIVSQSGSTLSKTDDGWKDTLKRVKAGSAKSNTINV